MRKHALVAVLAFVAVTVSGVTATEADEQPAAELYVVRPIIVTPANQGTSSTGVTAIDAVALKKGIVKSGDDLHL